MDELKRVIKSDGTIVVAVPREINLGDHTKDHIVHYTSLQQLIDELSEYGLETIESIDFGIDESAVVKVKLIKQL